MPTAHRALIGAPRLGHASGRRRPFPAVFPNSVGWFQVLGSHLLSEIHISNPANRHGS